MSMNQTPKWCIKLHAALVHTIRRIHVIVALVITTMTLRDAHAQEVSWKQHFQQLQTWASSVKQIKCHFLLSQFAPLEARQEKKIEWEKLLKAHPDAASLPTDANSTSVCFWGADAVRWRLDTNRLYPVTGTDFTQSLFDGERYTFYDSYRGRATITGQDNSFGFIKAIHTNTFIELGALDLVRSSFTESLGGLKYVGTSTVGDRHSVSFRAQSDKEELSVAVDQTTPLVLQWKDVFQSRPDYKSITTWTWGDIRAVQGVFLPFSCKFEMYEVVKGVTSWEQTKVFQMQDCQVNTPLGRGFFEDVLHLGTPVEDQINAPGVLSHVGGDYPDMIEKARVGAAPPLEVPGAINSGIAPTPSNKEKSGS